LIQRLGQITDALEQQLPQAKVPTLVMHLRDDAVYPFEFEREVAAGIPGRAVRVAAR
jgi:pimeloyl-ACP methyl ester carboxylesterase